MKLQLIRNATLKLSYGGRNILIDPFLAPKYSMDSFVGVSPNPTVELPYAPGDIVAGIDTVLVSHLHPDHFDPLAQELIPKDIEMLCQPGDETVLQQIGFETVTPIDATVRLQEIDITRTPGRHGTGVWAEQMGNVSGFILQAPDEPSVYIAGDTVYYDEIKGILSNHSPDVIVTNSGGAEFPGSGPIIMDAGQTVALTLDNPDATIIAIHLESLDHCKVTRKALRELARSSEIPDGRLMIPNDGETINL